MEVVPATLSACFWHPMNRWPCARAGWWCAQERPPHALAHLLHKLAAQKPPELPELLMVIDDDTWVNAANLVKLVNGPLLTNRSFVGWGPVGAPIPYGGAGYFMARPVLQALLQPANASELTDAAAGYHVPGARLEQVLAGHLERIRRERQQHRRQQQEQQQVAVLTTSSSRRDMLEATAAEFGAVGFKSAPESSIGASGTPSWIQACAEAKGGGPWCYFHSDWAVAECVLRATGGAVKVETHVGGRRDSRGFGVGFGLNFLPCPPGAAGKYATCHHMAAGEIIRREQETSKQAVLM